MKKKHDPIRRQLIKNVGLATGAAMLGGVATAQGKEFDSKSKQILRIAHISKTYYPHTY